MQLIDPKKEGGQIYKYKVLPVDFCIPMGERVIIPALLVLFIYKKISGDSFNKTQVIKSNNSFAGDLFGESVGLSDGKYIIGNPLATNDNAVSGGDVYFGNLQ